MEKPSNAKEEREKIFEFFIKNKKLKFSDIEKMSGLRSNYLSYHLEKMLNDEVIEKVDDYYKLTKKSEELIPFFANFTNKEVGVLTVVLSAIIKDNKICLIKREKRPYKGYWGLVGGKLKNGESIKDTALREVKEETNLDCAFNKIHNVIHERLYEDEKAKHSFVFFLTSLKPVSEKIISSDEGKVKWFDLKLLNKEEIIPSDYFMISELLSHNNSPIQLLMTEKDEKLLDFKRFS